MSNNFHRSSKFIKAQRIFSWFLSFLFIFGLSLGHLIAEYPPQRAKADSLTSIYDEEAATSNTTSTTVYTTKLSAASLVSGTQYFIFMTMGLRQSDTTARSNYRVRYEQSGNDDILYTGTLEPPGSASDQTIQVDWFDVYTPSANGTIIVEFKCASIGTTTAANAVLIGIDLDDRLVEDYDWYYGENTTLAAHNTTMVDKVTLTFSNADGVKDWLVFGMEDIIVNNQAKGHRMRFLYNNTTASMTRWQYGEDTRDQYSFATFRSFDNLARGDTIDLQVRDESFAGEENDHNTSRMFALNLQVFRDRVTHYQNVADPALATYPTWTVIQSESYSASSTGSHIMMGGYINDIAVAHAESTNKLEVDGTIFPPNWDWSDGSGNGGKVGYGANDLIHNNIIAAGTLNAGSRTITVSAQEIAGISQTNDEETLLAFSAEFNYMPRVNNWRWYADEEDTTPGTAYAIENTAPPQLEIGKSIGMKLRINFDEAGGLALTNTNRKKMYYSTASDGSVAWTELGETVDEDAAWRYHDGGGDDNSALSTIPLTGTTEAGNYNESNTTSNIQDHTADAIAEFEYCIENYNATADETYYFAFFDENVGLIPPASGKSFPTITTAASYALTVDSPSSVDFGHWQYGGSQPFEYDFSFPAETFTVRDNRGTAAGWSLTATMNPELYFQLVAGYCGSVSFTGSGLDDMTILSCQNTLVSQTDYKVEITGTGVPDMFMWYRNGNLAGMGSCLEIVELEEAVFISFAGSTGHTVGDYWEFTAYPAVNSTIEDGDTYWITNAISGIFDAPTTGVSGETGDYMGTPITAAVATSSNGLGGFTFIPSMQLRNLTTVGSYTGSLVFTLT